MNPLLFQCLELNRTIRKFKSNIINTLLGTLQAGQPMSSKANRMDLMELETKEMLTKKKCKIESAR